MKLKPSRRDFLLELGVSAAALPFVLNLPGVAEASGDRKQRLIIMFSPDGVVPTTFWPDEEGENFTLKESLNPLEPLRSRTLVLNGVCDRVRGDGDNHMRGIGCLLTGIELFPGNIQGGGNTPAGWASGLSIDQEIKNFLQSALATRTRFGSLELGVLVPERADTWTRMSYAGANKPVTPVDNPYQLFARLYGRSKDRQNLGSVMDVVREDLALLRSRVGAEDRKILDEHAGFVRDMEQELRSGENGAAPHAAPELEPGVREDNDNMPRLSKLQIELLVNSFSADFARVATLQYTNSVGQARMRWLGIEEGQHELSHKPDTDTVSQEKLTKINRWYCEQLAFLANRLAATPEPGRPGENLLDNTLIVWTNELGKGNTHTLDNIPFVLVGSAPGFRMGRSLKLPRVPHNRLLLSLAHAFGHRIDRFGNPDFCGEGPLSLS